jgi:hypothetical protein
LAAVSAAKSTGNGSILWPLGTSSIEDLPWDLASAIQHAARILHWRENLLTDDMPPEWMLPFDDMLVDWFEAVKEKHAEERGTSSSGDTEAPMMGNSMADDFRASS